MEIRRARRSDLERVSEIYERIHDEEEKGNTKTGWVRNVYPTIDSARQALERKDLFVLTDENGISASAIINQIPVKEYENADWSRVVEKNEVMVLHCLAVDPKRKGKGYGSSFVSFYQEEC